MPTAGKLVSAIVFALVAFLAADQYAQQIPDGRPAGILREVASLVGLVTGWLVVGTFLLKRRTSVETMGTGLRASVTLGFVTLVMFAVWDVMLKAMDGRYKNPMESVLDVFARILILGKPIFTPGVVGVLVLGGLLGGALAHWAASRWK